MKSVVKEWLSTASLQQQSAVLTCLRGCDGMYNADVSKKLVKKIRSLTLHNAKSSNAPFMIEEIDLDDVEEIAKDCDKYPVHFYMHLCFACEIIGFKHPDNDIKAFFKEAYHILVNAIHLIPETEEECDLRLKD